jgi:hypothetical protein
MELIKQLQEMSEESAPLYEGKHSKYYELKHNLINPNNNMHINKRNHKEYVDFIAGLDPANSYHQTLLDRISRGD